ncbi:hypothetical protein CSA80_02255 [Candidatus Saccharibacteria bacterium]|nr:MAG: hypothetical protein CR973_02670 [Candidatus Saccharibacteria bacterium]PID99560.1 MAG: hypothetical protein CSA80_02255 [Candidatus Saccharibacteria bacterium]
MKQTARHSTVKTTVLRPLQRLAMFFFARPRFTAALLLVVAGFGILSYSTLLKREGFPPINIPVAIGQGTYFVNDAERVDREVGKPVSQYLLKQSGVKSVRAKSLANFSTVIVEYEEDVDAAAASKQLQAEIVDKQIVPPGAKLSFEAARFGFTDRGDDAVVSFFSPANPSMPEKKLVPDAEAAARFFRSQNLSLVQDVSIISPLSKAVNPLTGQAAEVQKKFERFGERKDGKTVFYSSVPIGFTIVDGADVVAFNDQIQAAVEAYNTKHTAEGFSTKLSASFAPSIRQQISELQWTLIQGLLAVLVVGSVVIAVRASFMTVLSLLVIILAALGLLELIGYTLNTITLFSLILGLSLIVDDTIIMVEALDVQRRRKKDSDDIVATAVGRVGRAMLAGTLAAALSFAPLLFVGGVLGEFIRAIPVTIIAALSLSVILALIFIPFVARYVMLGKKHTGKHAEREIAVNVEQKVARGLASPMLWAQHSRLKMSLVGGSAVLLSLLFIGASGFLFQKVKFNIFPPSKDTNTLIMSTAFAPGTTIETAQVATDEALQKLKGVLGEDFAYGAHYGAASPQSANYYIELVDYSKRETTAPQYLKKLKVAFKDFRQARVSFRSQDAGPPASPFTAKVRSDSNREGAKRLVDDVVAFLRKADIRRADDSKVRFESIQADTTDVLTRADGNAFVGLTARFVDSDTTALVTLTKDAVEKAFPPERVARYGVEKDALQFDFGQEDENQNSFQTLVVALPIVLLVIYAVLAVQFRSLLQPLLIFLAIPFSLFGVTLGLVLSDNPFSFFAMLGFFALIGLSIKNTILLTDYANQARRAGMGAVDAAREALAERFRPLLATSMTAMVSLLPLAVTSPFWQGLAVVLICGLLSSTFLVLTVFPYYYLGAEALRGVWSSRVSGPLKRRLRRAA